MTNLYWSTGPGALIEWPLGDGEGGRRRRSSPFGDDTGQSLSTLYWTDFRRRHRRGVPHRRVHRSDGRRRSSRRPERHRRRRHQCLLGQHARWTDPARLAQMTTSRSLLLVLLATSCGQTPAAPAALLADTNGTRLRLEVYVADRSVIASAGAEDHSLRHRAPDGVHVQPRPRRADALPSRGHGRRRRPPGLLRRRVYPARTLGKHCDAGAGLLRHGASMRLDLLPDRC